MIDHYIILYCFDILILHGVIRADTSSFVIFDMVAKKRIENICIDKPDDLKIPVEEIKKITGNEEKTTVSKDIAIVDLIVGKNNFEFVINTGNVILDNITVDVDDDNHINVFNGDHFYIRTSQIPVRADYESISYHYNKMTRILTISGKLRDKKITIKGRSGN